MTACTAGTAARNEVKRGAIARKVSMWVELVVYEEHLKKYYSSK